jgi:hypothetical protein
MIFDCIRTAIKGFHHIGEYLNKITDIDDVYDFIKAITEFGLDSLKKKCDGYFSYESRLRNLCCNKLLRIINESGMDEMKKTLAVILRQDEKMLGLLKFEELTDDDMRFFIGTTWQLFIKSFALWVKSDDLSDETIENIYFSFRKTPKQFIQKIKTIVSSLTNCPKFQAKVFYDLLSIDENNEHVTKKQRTQ